MLIRHLPHLSTNTDDDISIPSTTELSTSQTCLAPNMAATEDASLALRAAQEAYVEQKDRCVTCRAVGFRQCLTYVPKVYSAVLVP
jgi:hypothetical protein